MIRQDILHPEIQVHHQEVHLLQEIVEEQDLPVDPTTMAQMDEGDKL